MQVKKPCFYIWSVNGIKQVILMQTKYLQVLLRLLLIHEPNVSFIMLIVFDFPTMLSQCHHLTPEPRFQTENGETFVKGDVFLSRGIRVAAHTKTGQKHDFAQ